MHRGVHLCVRENPDVAQFSILFSADSGQAGLG